MIGFLRGQVAELGTDHCLLDVNGVGYRIYIPARTREELHKGDTVTLYTHMSVREDAIQLYGFRESREYDLFRELINVSGIGPKVALGIISTISLPELAAAIQNEQIKVLTRLPGIGKKSAERLILELRDKLAFAGDEVPQGNTNVAPPVGDDAIAQATAALLQLQYTPAEIAPVMKDMPAGRSTADIIKLALAKLNKLG